MHKQCITLQREPDKPLLVGLSREHFQSSHNPLACSCRAAHDQDRIVTADCAKDVRPGLPIECGGDGLSSAGHCSQDDHLAHAIYSEEELREKRLECSPALFDAAVGYRVASAFRSRHASQP